MCYVCGVLVVYVHIYGTSVCGVCQVCGVVCVWVCVWYNVVYVWSVCGVCGFVCVRCLLCVFRMSGVYPCVVYVW